MAIGAPATRNIDEKDLPAEARIVVGNDPTLKIREAEVQSSGTPPFTIRDWTLWHWILSQRNS
jgi:hypothetical protein